MASSIDRTMVRCRCGCPPYSECHQQIDGIRGAPCGHGRHPFWEENAAQNFRAGMDHDERKILHTVQKVFVRNPATGKAVCIDYSYCPTCDILWKNYSKANDAIKRFLKQAEHNSG